MIKLNFAVIVAIIIACNIRFIRTDDLIDSHDLHAEEAMREVL
jgi:hypothetical protein